MRLGVIMNRLKDYMPYLLSLIFALSVLSCGDKGDLGHESDGSESTSLQSYEECQQACLDKDRDSGIRECQAKCSERDRDETDRERDDECSDGDKVSREETWYLCKDGAWYAWDDDKNCEDGDELEKDGVTYLCDEEGKWQEA